MTDADYSDAEKNCLGSLLHEIDEPENILPQENAPRPSENMNHKEHGCSAVQRTRAGEMVQGKTERHGGARTGDVPDAVVQPVVSLLLAGHLEKAEKRLDDTSLDSKLTANKAFYHSLIHACARAGNPSAAGWVMLKMSRMGLQPNSVTFNSVIDACAKVGDVELAMQWWEHMRQLGLRPNGITYNTMINACSQARDPQRAEWWMQEPQPRQLVCLAMAGAGLGALSVLLVFSSTLAPALGYCSADNDCTNCNGNSMTRCTGCKPGYYLSDMDGDGEGFCYPGSDDGSDHYSCEWRDEYAEDWYGKILVGSLIGFAITLGTTITLSLPVCCGVMKNANVKVIGIICGIIGGLSLFIPFISGAVSSGALVEDICDACTHGCSDTDRDELNTHLGALGVIVAYIHGMGFLVVVMGAVTLCLSCCTCCPCCGPLKADNNVTPVNPNAPQGQVVGQPVDQAAKAS